MSPGEARSETPTPTPARDRALIACEPRGAGRSGRCRGGARPPVTRPRVCPDGHPLHFLLLLPQQCAALDSEASTSSAACSVDGFFSRLFLRTYHNSAPFWPRWAHCFHLAAVVHD